MLWVSREEPCSANPYYRCRAIKQANVDVSVELHILLKEIPREVKYCGDIIAFVSTFPRSSWGNTSLNRLIEIHRLLLARREGFEIIITRGLK